MIAWRRGTRRPGYTSDEVLEVVELPDGERVAIRNARFWSERGVQIPAEAWEDFRDAVKRGEFDELPRKRRRE